MLLFLKAFLLVLATEFASSAPIDDAQVKVITETITSTSTMRRLAVVTEIVTFSSPLPPTGPTLPLPPHQSAAGDPSESVLSTIIATITTTVNGPPATITVTGPVVTITEFITRPVEPPTPTFQEPSEPIPTPVPSSEWSAPNKFTDLAAFGISKFAYGQSNLQIVSGIPATASAVVAWNEPRPTPFIPWDNSSTVLQLFYPQNSINPGNRPQGGADFYATPVALDQANSVTLAYSVFFPADFEWNQAGKLPGLYGGHAACSGGHDAEDCFSSRLMWRRNGLGELYLYAPKDSQTRAFCQTPPQSVCESTYGLSIGRGSFSFARGAWTHIQQTLRLNTPGLADGGFMLKVNGQTVIESNEVYYRHARTIEGSTDVNGDQEDLEWLPPPPPIAPEPPSIFDLNGQGSDHDLTYLSLDLDLGSTPLLLAESSLRRLGSPLNDAEPAKHNGNLPIKRLSLKSLPKITEEMSSQQPAGFLGIFFSTFFGGHEPKYATPKDQYTWFKDFSIHVDSWT